MFLQDGIIEQVHELLLDTLSIQAHTLGFPELCLPVVMEVRFLLFFVCGEEFLFALYQGSCITLKAYFKVGFT